MPRSVIYIDGLNLYYGALKDTQWKWLNLDDYFHRVRNGDSIQAIKYFTALAPSKDQEDYLSAIGTTNVEIILGAFKNKRIACRVRNCSHTGSRKFAYREEKRTDVNIGIHMVNDGYKNLYDLAVLVTGDSGIVPALEMVKQEFPTKQLICYVPDFFGYRGIGADLQKTTSSRCRILPNILLKQAQFPTQIMDSQGKAIVKPSTW